jgi:hypothetical protein
MSDGFEPLKQFLYGVLEKARGINYGEKVDLGTIKITNLKIYRVQFISDYNFKTNLFKLMVVLLKALDGWYSRQIFFFHSFMIH